MLYLLICVGVTVALGSLGFQYLDQVFGSSNVLYRITKAEMTSATSLPRMMVAMDHGSRPDMAREMTIVVTRALSAAGSAMEPKTVYFPVRRAIQPSRRSVMEAIKRSEQAGMKEWVATR